MRLTILGAGFSGLSIARELAGEAEVMVGTTRSTARFAALSGVGLKPMVFDGDVSEDLAVVLASTTHLVQSAAPDEDGDPFLRFFPQGLRAAMPALRWAGYLSTVGVYGDHGGDWIDEGTPCRPVSTRSKQRVAAENAWMETGKADGFPVAVIRLSGIYGPGRNQLKQIEAGTARRLIKPGQVFNRIHVADIGGATAHLARNAMDGLFNVTDDRPAPPQEVVAFAATLMEVEPPPEVAFETAELTPMARSFYGENKRVSNARIMAFGYAFRYPDYEAGLGALWREGSWKG